MNVITTAIISAIVAGIVTGAKDVSRQAITDLYNQLKEKIVKQTGENSEVIEAIKQVEKNPESGARQQILEEEITKQNLEQDQMIVALANQLIDVVGKQVDAKAMTTVQNILGQYNVVAGSGGTATGTFNIEYKDQENQ